MMITMNSDQKFTPVFGKIYWEDVEPEIVDRLKKSGFYSWGWLVGDEVWVLNSSPDFHGINMAIYNYIEYGKWVRKIMPFSKIKREGWIRAKIPRRLVGNSTSLEKPEKTAYFPLLPWLSLKELEEIEFRPDVAEKIQGVVFHVF